MRLVDNFSPKDVLEESGAVGCQEADSNSKGIAAISGYLYKCPKPKSAGKSLECVKRVVHEKWSRSSYVALRCQVQTWTSSTKTDVSHG